MFPSPCGEKVGINRWSTPRGAGKGGFPSPCGEKVGINSMMDWLTDLEGWEFPSPCGEKVGINCSLLSIIMKNISQFPSPCGEKVGINLANGRDFWVVLRTVSVPLRGKGRDQRWFDKLPGKPSIGSFRPLAGKR